MPRDKRVHNRLNIKGRVKGAREKSREFRQKVRARRRMNGGFSRISYDAVANPTELGDVSIVNGCSDQDLQGIWSPFKKKRQKQQMMVGLAVAGGLAVGWYMWKMKKKKKR